METIESVTQETQASPERIGFGKRFGAYLIDFVLAGIVGGIIGSQFGDGLANFFYGAEMDEAMGQLESVGFEGFEGMMEGMMGSMAGVAVVFLAIMLLDAILGQTIGKMILGIKNGTDDGKSADMGKLFLRAIIKYIGTVMAFLMAITSITFLGTLGDILGFVVFIGFFFVLGEKKQGFHDMIAKTAVFNKSDLN